MMTPEERVAARTREVEEGNASLWFTNDEIAKYNLEIQARAAEQERAELEAQTQFTADHEAAHAAADAAVTE